MTIVASSTSFLWYAFWQCCNFSISTEKTGRGRERERVRGRGGERVRGREGEREGERRGLSFCCLSKLIKSEVIGFGWLALHRTKRDPV